MERTFYISNLTNSELVMLQCYLQGHADDDEFSPVEEVREPTVHPSEQEQRLSPTRVNKRSDRASLAIMGLDLESHRACVAQLHRHRRQAA